METQQRLPLWLAHLAAVSLLILFTIVEVAGAPRLQDAAKLVRAEGAVYLDGQLVADLSSPATLGASAVIRTGAGRAAVSLKRGGSLLLSDDSSVRVLANGVYNFNRIEVLAGSVVIISAESAPLVACQSEARLSSAGIFRFDVRPPDAAGRTRCRFRIYEGAAAAPATTVINALRPGQSIDLPAGDMVPVFDFSPTDLDEFDRWSRANVIGLNR
jgi:hypothetical protein